MLEGIARVGDRPDYFPESAWPRLDIDWSIFSAHVFYGLEGHLPKIFRFAMEKSRAVYVDLGYWGRREGGRYSGYHKVSINARHPSAYFREPQHNGRRFDRFKIRVRPWEESAGARAGGHVLIAGMGAKGAAAEGYAPQVWERAAVAELKRYTSREIVYRPKPSDPLASPIAGTLYSPKDRTLEEELANCWAVVTHHSNVAVDALLAGIPCFCWGGVARSMSLQDLAHIEIPYLPNWRYQWACDIAWQQWSIEEMRRGDPWAYLRGEGLV